MNVAQVLFVLSDTGTTLIRIPKLATLCKIGEIELRRQLVKNEIKTDPCFYDNNGRIKINGVLNYIIEKVSQKNAIERAIGQKAKWYYISKLHCEWYGLDIISFKDENLQEIPFPDNVTHLITKETYRNGCEKDVILGTKKGDVEALGYLRFDLRELSKPPTREQVFAFWETNAKE